MKNVVFNYDDLTAPIFAMHRRIRKMKDREQVLLEKQKCLILKEKINQVLQALSQSYTIYLFSYEKEEDMRNTLKKQGIFYEWCYCQIPKKTPFHAMYSEQFDYQHSIFFSGNQLYAYISMNTFTGITTCMVEDLCNWDFVEVAPDYKIQSFLEIPQFLSELQLSNEKHRK